jgi:phospholipid transport system transporter-binding protein
VARRSRRADSASQPATLTAAAPGRYALAGDVGFDNAARVLAEGEAAFATLGDVEVDLAGVGRVDSAGLALLLEWSTSAREAGKSVRYRNVPPAISALAGLSDVSELLDSGGGGPG